MIRNIELTLEAHATRKYIVRARIVSMGGRSVDAIAKADSLESAQQSAIEAAKERLADEFGAESTPTPAPNPSPQKEPPLQRETPTDPLASTKGPAKVWGDQTLMCNGGDLPSQPWALEICDDKDNDCDGHPVEAIPQPMEGQAESTVILRPLQEELSQDTCDLVDALTNGVNYLQQCGVVPDEEPLEGWTPGASPETCESNDNDRDSAAINGQCKSCGAAIRWGTTAKGKPHPLDMGGVRVKLRGVGKGSKLWIFSPDGTISLSSTWPAQPAEPGSVTGYVSHFSTCPNADQHRRKSKAKPTTPPISPEPTAPEPPEPATQETATTTESSSLKISDSMDNSWGEARVILMNAVAKRDELNMGDLKRITQQLHGTTSSRDLTAETMRELATQIRNGPTDQDKQVAGMQREFLRAAGPTANLDDVRAVADTAWAVVLIEEVIVEWQHNQHQRGAA